MSLLESVKLNIKYYLALPEYLFTRYHAKIKTIDETLDYMKQPGNCIVRFGDGEFAVLDGNSIVNYQQYNETLQKCLERVIGTLDKPNLLVCLPETIVDLRKFVTRSKKIWTINLVRNKSCYLKYIDANYTYGNSFVSRPYMIYKDKGKAQTWFESFREIFRGKDILLVEGKYSRNGVGNDLFSEASSVRRILCPNTDAFSKYNDILNEVIKAKKNELILLAIGPASKPLTLELAERGYWVLDIGHIDSEYEWYLKHANKKISIANKHTAELVDKCIEACEDKDYLASIVAIIE